MKTERKDRKRTFKQMLDKSNNVVADELLFTATHKFFDGMNRNQIKDWADTCMEFVYKDLGYTKEQVLLSVVHLDEETPHIHCVVILLVKKFDKRTNTERYTITKKEYIKVKKETFKSMNNVTKENNSLMKVQERVERVFKTVDEHIKSYDTLEEENLKLNREVINLIYKNNDLKLENNKLKDFIYNLLEKLKKLFRKILFRGDYELKDLVCDQVKDIYDNKEFDNKDVYNIIKGTEKQDELFEYVDIPSYMKENIKYNYEEDRDNGKEQKSKMNCLNMQIYLVI